MDINTEKLERSLLSIEGLCYGKYQDSTTRRWTQTDLSLKIGEQEVYIAVLNHSFKPVAHFFPLTYIASQIPHYPTKALSRRYNKVKKELASLGFEIDQDADPNKGYIKA